MACEYMDSPRCPRGGCLYPHGICMFGLHRVDTEQMEEMAIQFVGPEPETEPKPKETPVRDAFAALVKWWKSNHGMRQAFRQAVRAYKTRHIPDPFKEQA